MFRPVTMIVISVGIVVLMLAPQVRPWVEQRSRINALRAEVAENHRDVQAMEAERRRWRDPAYVETQARARLHFVFPGETGYVVLDDRPGAESDAGGSGSVDTAPTGENGARDPGGDRPWYDDLWRSMTAAGEEGTGNQESGAATGSAKGSATTSPAGQP
jgi:hypothetical protein